LEDVPGNLLLEIYSGALESVPWVTLESDCPPKSWTTCDIPVHFKTLVLDVLGLSVELENGQLELVSSDGADFDVRSGECWELAGDCPNEFDFPASYCAGAVFRLAN
jgi:hypothetical protein